MMLIIVIIFVILLGFGFIIIGNKFEEFNIIEVVGGIIFSFGSISLIFSAVMIIVVHTCADYTIERSKLEYEGLCKRYEIITSDYEDVSKSDVIEDIIEWNIEVYNAKYWSESLWTNWYNPKKISDNLNYIPLEE